MDEVPTIDCCLVCEDARNEVGNKLTVLGYFGVAPKVEIGITDPTIPVKILLLFEGSGGRGLIDGMVDLVDVGGTVLASKPFDMDIDPTKAKFIIGVHFSAILPKGNISIVMRDHERTLYESAFRIIW